MLAMMEMSRLNVTQRDIAAIFGVSKTTVQRILDGSFKTGKQRGKA